ncbi:MAG: DNA primase [Thermodesulfobacteriota bacterium]|nr:DNA primase [Thermodesulfobacteriota bacterium]
MTNADGAAIIKQAVDIVDLIGQVVPLRRAGRRHVGLCPFHKEKTPSFSVDAENGFFYCFGCGAGGDVLAFAMKHWNLNFPEALRYLADRYNVTLPETGRDNEQVRKERDAMFAVLEAACDFFYRELHHSESGKAAREYLKKRSLPEKTVERQRLGYAPNAWDVLLRHFRHRGLDPRLGVKAGLFVESAKGSIYDRFRNRLMFPIADDRGRVVAFGGRSLDGSEPKYLNSPETAVYHKGRTLYQFAEAREACRELRQVVLVEGYLDLLSFHAQDFYRVAATLGTALTAPQVRLLHRIADEVVLVYDADPAGRKAMFRALPLFLDEELAVTTVDLPSGMDPDDFLKSEGIGAFEKLMETRRDLGSVAIDDALSSWDGTSVGKGRVIQQLQPILGGVSHPVLRSDYVRRVAERLALSEDVVDRQLASGKAGVPGPRRPESTRWAGQMQPPSTGVQAVASPEETLVRLMVRHPVLIDEVRTAGVLERFAASSLRSIAEALFQTVDRPEAFDPRSVYERLADDEARALFSRLLLEDDTGDLEFCRLVLHERMASLRRRDAVQRRAALQAAIEEAEKNGDFGRLQELLREMQSIHKVESRTQTGIR